MSTGPQTAALEAAFKRGVSHGYDMGLRDGRLTPQELAAKHLKMKTWIPKRRSDKQPNGSAA